MDHIDFVSESIWKLVNHRCVREVQTKPVVGSPLSVVTNHEGKCRLVLNLRQFLRKDYFIYEDLRIALLMFEQSGAVKLVLESFCPKFQNERVRWFTDNQNVVRIVLCGSKKKTYSSTGGIGNF